MPDETSPETTAATGDLVRPDRTFALTDAVVAIAMTLLALDLKPDLPGPTSSHHLASYLGHHLAQYGSFVIAFALIAQYWLTHHRLMQTVRNVSNRLMGETLVFLFGVTLVPLSTYLTGTYGNALAVTIFAANIFLVSLALNLAGGTIHRERLDLRQESEAARSRRRAKGAAVLAIPALVAGLAWVMGTQASWFYLLFYAVDLPGRLADRRSASA